MHDRFKTINNSFSFYDFISWYFLSCLRKSRSQLPRRYSRKSYLIYYCAVLGFMAFIRRFREKKGKEERFWKRDELRISAEVNFGGLTKGPHSKPCRCRTFFQSLGPASIVSCVNCILLKVLIDFPFFSRASPKLLCHHKHLFLPKEHEKKS